METIRSVDGSSKTEAEIRDFLSSSMELPEVLAKAIRRHSQIENILPWVLDVTFNEDHCRIRDRNAVQNLSLLRKIAINPLRRHDTSKTSLKVRRKMAGWNNQYMEHVVAGIFHA